MNILCPVDFSDAATHALDYAARFAQNKGAALTLLQIVKPQKDQSQTELRVAEAEKKLLSYCKLVKEEFKIRCQASAKVHSSSLENSLAQEIAEGQDDLIIMGTNGADDLNQFYFGSHSYKMLRHTTIPLLIVPEECNFKKPKHIVYALDYEKDDVKALQMLYQLTEIYKPHIVILHVGNDSPSRNEEISLILKKQMPAKISSHIHFDFKSLGTEDIADEIDQYMRDTDSDLLVLLHRSYNFIEKLFHQSMTKKLSFIADYPILVYNPGQNSTL